MASRSRTARAAFVASCVAVGWFVLCSSVVPAVAATAGDTEERLVLRRRRPGSTGNEFPRRTPGEPTEPSETRDKPKRDAPPVAPPKPRVAPPDFVAMPDRWRIVENIGVNERWHDPYNQSTLKADRPIFDDWFINLSAVLDSVVEGRRLPVGKGIQATANPGDFDVFGDGDQLLAAQNLIVETSLIKGNTTFKPPDWEFRFVGVANANYARVGERGIVSVDPDRGRTRHDAHLAVQELFVDRHLHNKSDYFDFDSARVGIQEFITDFRGFLYEDSQPGVRLFGNFARNRVQYNLAWFRRLEKDTNSGLNSVFEMRDDDVFVANAYFQDLPIVGLTTEALVVYNRNREGDDDPFFNDNGFIERPASIGDERPHDYDVVYLGTGLDGHIGRVNLTTNAFLALGKDEYNSIAGKAIDIVAHMVAAEASVDFDWFRTKAFFLHASGDDDPFDGTGNGFDAIFENANFAGADTSFWHRQNIPLVGGGGVALSGRDSLLPALRSSKEHGQSNFVNRGLFLIGVGGDFDLSPQLRLTFNASRLQFDDTAVLRTARQQAKVDSLLGYDLSTALLWRPLFTQNIIFRASGAVLIPGEGFDDLYDDKYDLLFSTLLNMTLTY